MMTKCKLKRGGGKSGMPRSFRASCGCNFAMEWAKVNHERRIK